MKESKSHQALTVIRSIAQVCCKFGASSALSSRLLLKQPFSCQSVRRTYENAPTQSNGQVRGKFGGTSWCNSKKVKMLQLHRELPKNAISGAIRTQLRMQRRCAGAVTLANRLGKNVE